MCVSEEPPSRNRTKKHSALDEVVKTMSALDEIAKEMSALDQVRLIVGKFSDLKRGKVS